MLCVEDNSVTLMLGMIIVGLGHLRNGLRYKSIMISQLHSMRGRGFIVTPPLPLFSVFQSPLPVPLDLPPSDVLSSQLGPLVL